MTINDTIDLIMHELRMAEKKHPGWPDDPIHGVAIMIEEAGEAMQAALDLHYRNAPVADLRKELAQTGAMAIRALLNL
jgi:NTP pyrophosphatase (non-canonical NTP hydrolase)